MPGSAYTGRFAPTPSGRLHFGSVIVCLGAFLRARSLNGRLLLRIDDLDRPRCPPGMDRTLISELHTLGFEFDGATVYESQRLEYYQSLCHRLKHSGRAFYCTCTRAALKARPCECFKRPAPLSPRPQGSLRFLPPKERVESFEDELAGWVQAAPVRGFLCLRRADGVFAYNLASVGDDLKDKVSEVVRGRDLLETTPGQIALCRALGQPEPRYLHLPLALNARQDKLSKQNHAPAVLERAAPAEVLLQALQFLGQDTTALDKGMTPKAILHEACRRFSLTSIPTDDRCAPPQFC